MRALVLSGGGANGAFQAGVVYEGLTQGVHWDIVVGTSVGSGNGAVIAQYERGKESDAAAHLKQQWLGLKGDADVYVKWFPKWIRWLFPAMLPFLLKWKPSIYSSKPWNKMVERHVLPDMLKSSGKKFVAVAVPWGGQSQTVTWDEQSEHIVKAIQASSAFPLMFTPVDIEGMWYTDGGLRAITPVKIAIELGATKIDVVQCSSGVMSKGKDQPKGLDQLKRMAAIVLDEVDKDDYREAEYVNKLVRCGCKEARPSWKVIEIGRVKPGMNPGDSLDFSPKKNRKLFEWGQQVGRKYKWL